MTLNEHTDNFHPHNTTVSAEQQRRQDDYDTDNRFSLLGMEIPELDQLGHAPIIAAPAAVGYGPTVAMPTLIGMMPSIDDFQDDVEGEEGEDTSSAPEAQVKLRVKSPGVGKESYSQKPIPAFPYSMLKSARHAILESWNGLRIFAGKNIASWNHYGLYLNV